MKLNLTFTKLQAIHRRRQAVECSVDRSVQRLAADLENGQLANEISKCRAAITRSTKSQVGRLTRRLQILEAEADRRMKGAAV